MSLRIATLAVAVCVCALLASTGLARAQQSDAEQRRDACLLQQDFVSARSACTTAINMHRLQKIDDDKTLADLHVKRGDSLVSFGRFEDATTDYDQALQLVPRHAGALVSRGFVKLRLNRVGQAEQDFRLALDAAPTKGPVHRGLGYVAMEKQNYRDAVEHFTDAMAYDRLNSAYYYDRAKAHVGAGTPDLALADFKAAIEGGVDFADIYVDRARLHASLGHFEEAKRDLDSALERRPGSPAQIIAMRGMILQQAGKFEESERDLSEALAMIEALRLPPDPNYLAARAVARANQRKLKEALEDAELAAKLAPSPPIVRLRDQIRSALGR